MIKSCFLDKQKGAMFGLDARIALVIITGLSVVAGASMIQILSDRRMDTLLFEQDKYGSAVAAIQEDLKTNIHDSLTTSNDENAYLALVDSSLLTTAAQNNWLGPYLKDYYSNNHKQYGVMTLARENTDISGSCSAAEITGRECFYYLTISQVPQDVIDKLNTALDGSEGSPGTQGNVQWDSISGSTARVYMRLGLVAP